MSYKNNEDKLAYLRKYWKEHPKYREKSKLYAKKWREDNREKYITSRKQRYQERKGELQEKARNYYREVRSIKRLNNPIAKKQERRWALNRIAKLKNFIQAMKVEMGGVCRRCEYKDEPRILQFHHFNGKKDKKGNISEMKSLIKIRLEAAKCILLCPNCHALTHLN